MLPLERGRPCKSGLSPGFTGSKDSQEKSLRFSIFLFNTSTLKSVFDRELRERARKNATVYSVNEVKVAPKCFDVIQIFHRVRHLTLIDGMCPKQLG